MKTKLCKGTVLPLIRAQLALPGLCFYLPALSEVGEIQYPMKVQDDPKQCGDYLHSKAN